MSTTRNETVRDFLTDATRRLRRDVGDGTARVEALALMRLATGFKDNAKVIAEDARELDAATREKFMSALERRLRGEPIAYVLGRREFYGRDFLTNPSALIPRPETELLVDLALTRRIAPAASAINVLDLATGSGVAGISIFLESANSVRRMTLTDNDESALALARENARRLGANGLDFRAGDFYRAVAGERFDLIVCNPPYIAEGDECMTRGDLRFEPRGALAAGADGFSALRVVIEGAADFLAPAGRLIVEHGAEQGLGCRRMAQAAGLTGVETVRDLAGLERATTGIIAG